MPLVCIQRPNRTKPRHWGPAGLTRVFEKVCELDGKDAAWAAVTRARCGDVSDLAKALQNIEDFLQKALAGYAALQGIVSGLQRFFGSAAWRYVLRWIPGVQVIESDIAALSGFLETIEAATIAEDLAVVAGIIAVL